MLRLFIFFEEHFWQSLGKCALGRVVVCLVRDCLRYLTIGANVKTSILKTVFVMKLLFLYLSNQLTSSLTKSICHRGDSSKHSQRPLCQPMNTLVNVVGGACWCLSGLFHVLDTINRRQTPILLEGDGAWVDVLVLLLLDGVE